jgi:hypothetical protein
MFFICLRSWLYICMFYETISILEFVEKYPIVVFLGCILRPKPWILIYPSTRVFLRLKKIPNKSITHHVFKFRHISDLCLFDYHWHILGLISKLYVFIRVTSLMVVRIVPLLCKSKLRRGRNRMYSVQTDCDCTYTMKRKIDLYSTFCFC